MSTKPPVDDSITSTTVSSVTDLIKAPYDEIEYGRAVFVAQKENGDRVLHSGRVVSRNYPFITLRRKSHRVEVNLKDRDWELDDWMPIRSPIEKRQIEAEYST